ncbi:MAG: MATE family efflux transporter, partial [Proteobacteria bacterium]|nr:MATE family efflux transporter [Pseudomonadota bacterium]
MQSTRNEIPWLPLSSCVLRDGIRLCGADTLGYSVRFNFEYAPTLSKPRQAGNFTQGSIGRHMVRLTGFMVMGFLAMTLSQLVEAVYLGFVGTDELAAIAFSFPVVMAMNAATRGIGIGASAVLARAMGQDERDLARRLTSHCLMLVLVFTLACSVAGWLYAEQLFYLMGARGHILQLTIDYMHIWFIAAPMFGLSMVGVGLMRAIGDPAYPGYVMTAGSVLQVIFGPFLIFGWIGIPALGIEGAAWAFVLARSLALIMALYWFVVKERMLQFSLEHFGTSSRDILHVGIPAGATNLIQPLSMGVSTWLLADYGHAVVAGFGVASRIDSVVTMIVIAISASVPPLVGQNWGARRFDRVHQVLRLSYQASLVWGVMAAVLMWG